MTAARFGVRWSRRPAADPSGPGADVARQAEQAGRDPTGPGEGVSSDKRPPDGVREQGERYVEAAAAVAA
jgi:hypothetical protein